MTAVRNVKSKRSPLPPRIPYGAVMALMRPYLRLRFGYKADREAARDMDEQFVLLSTHGGNYDFMFAYTAVYPRSITPVVSRYFFNNSALAVLLRAFKCIPKDQFRPDASAIRRVRETTRAGGSILLYPEGEVTGMGMNEVFMPTGKLLKLLSLPVYAVVMEGSCLCLPKWARHDRKGRIDARISRIMTADEVKSLSVCAIEEKVASALCHDEYEWQENTMRPFECKAPAEGLELLLYRCPACGREFTMASSGHELVCSACGNKAVMDEYGFLSPASETDVVYRHPSDWVRMQFDELKKEVVSPDFSLSTPASVQLHLSSKRLHHTDVGHGTVTLDHSGITYRGSIDERYRERFKELIVSDGDAFVLHFPMEQIIKLPFTANVNFEVPNPVMLIAFAPDDMRTMQKYLQAVTVMKGLV